jgi:hypothetical protein
MNTKNNEKQLIDIEDIFIDDEFFTTDTNLDGTHYVLSSLKRTSPGMIFDIDWKRRKDSWDKKVKN